jgi:hypothetical protein
MFRPFGQNQDFAAFLISSDCIGPQREIDVVGAQHIFDAEQLFVEQQRPTSDQQPVREKIGIIESRQCVIDWLRKIDILSREYVCI